MFNYKFIDECWNKYVNSKTSQIISQGETMNNKWYYEVGENAAHVVLAAIAASHLGSVNKVLDMPCGHGRVLRHLVKLFPAAEITACDLDVDGVEFCAKEFGAKPLVSLPDLTKVDFPNKYDLIWIGSLFTHVPRAQTISWFHHLSQYLSDTGIIVATFHGRRAIQVYDRDPYIARPSWDAIIDQYRTSGYGYADYLKSENHEYIEHGYGVSLSSAESILEIVQGIPGVRIFSYIEAGWADNQDVLVFGKPGL
jgi:trans-aconitate methyltransferase